MKKADSKNVKCKIIDQAWLKRNCGDPNLTIDINRARRLQDQKMIEIVDPVNDAKQKTITNYQNKVLTAENGYLTRSKFSLKKNIKIAYVQDYSKLGGAELSNQHVVSVGENLGFDVVGITPGNFHNNILYSADLIIINNFFEFNALQFDTISKAIYERNIPYIKYDHDHRELKRINISKQLFSRSVKNIFISPLHEKKFIETIGEQIKDFSVSLPLSLNLNLISNIENIKKEKNSVFVPCYRKCGVNIIDYMKKHTDKKYYVINKSEIPSVSGVDVVRLPLQNYEETIKLFYKCEEMLHLPTGFWAGERIYFEALLCDCFPIVNKNVGHLSWSLQKQSKVDLIQALKTAPYKFWRIVELCLQQKK